MLERLTALSGDHFNVSPGEINWGHAGTLAHYGELLKRITRRRLQGGRARPVTLT